MNNWGFDRFNSKRVINSLKNANIDVIECGYLRDKVEHDNECTLFTTIEDAENALNLKVDKTYAIIINQGEVNVEKIKAVDNDSKIIAIRVEVKK